MQWQWRFLTVTVTTLRLHPHCTRHERRSKLGCENPSLQQQCPHCMQQATYDAISIRMGPGSIFIGITRRALLPVWIGPDTFEGCEKFSFVLKELLCESTNAMVAKFTKPALSDAPEMFAIGWKTRKSKQCVFPNVAFFGGSGVQGWVPEVLIQNRGIRTEVALPLLSRVLHWLHC